MTLRFVLISVHSQFVAVEDCKAKAKPKKLPRLWFVLKVDTSFHLLDPCGGMKNKSMGCLGGNCMGLCFVLRIRQVLDVVFVAQDFIELQASLSIDRQGKQI